MRFGVFSNVPPFSVRFEYLTFTRIRLAPGRTLYCTVYLISGNVHSSSLVPLIVVNWPIIYKNSYGVPRHTSITIRHHHPLTVVLVCIVDVFTPSSMAAFHVAKPFTPLKVYCNIVSRCSFPTMRQNRCHHA